MDEKIKMILDLIEDDGDTFAKRAEMYYQKKPQLIKMVHELHGSYRALADKYDQLKSESSIRPSNNGSVSNSLHHNSHLINLSPVKFSVAAGSDESGTSSVDIDHSPKKNTLPNDEADDEKNEREEVGGVMREKVWDEQIKFSKLLEENLAKQSELIRRNDEKREVINELRNNEKRILSHKAAAANGSSHKAKQFSQKKNLRGLFCLA